MTEQITGAQSLIRSLETAGVEVVFGIPGGAILPAYDPLFDSSIRHILVRHEQGAGHAAEGYALATGRVGRVHRDVGTRRHQPGDADRRRAHGLDTDGRHHRPGAQCRDRDGRLPGGGHPRHHDADHEAQLPRDQSRGDPAGGRGGLPHRQHRPTRPRARGCVQGRHAGDDDVRLAAVARPAGLPPGDPSARQAGARGRPAARRGEAPGAVRRRRCAPGPCRPGAARTGRARRRASGDDADGTRRVPRQPPAAPRHARDARHGGGGDRPAEERPHRRARSTLR